MLTRCPSCATTFRITPEQIKAKQGRVRCGQCQTVFNAIETLAEAPAAPAAETTADDEIAVSPAPTFETGATDLAPMDAAPAQPTEIAAAAADEPAAEPESLTDYDPSLDTLLAAEAPRRRWPWVLGATLALLGIGAQAGYHFRAEIAVLAPQAKPAMQALCAALGCDLPLPRKSDLMGIETSDLHPEPSNPGQLQLVATLKNRAPFAQEYPHLELTLTDTTDKAVVRRVLAPADYLPQTRPVAAGFAAGSDLPVSLTLEVRNAAPIGYRLYVFYP
jgi:predicted Zn finger-like uncharacterized protein